jgi:hypothetical protein
MKFFLFLSIACILAECTLLDLRSDFAHSLSNNSHSFLAGMLPRNFKGIVNIQKLGSRGLLPRVETCNDPTYGTESLVPKLTPYWKIYNTY